MVLGSQIGYEGIEVIVSKVSVLWAGQLVDGGRLE